MRLRARLSKGWVLAGLCLASGAVMFWPGAARRLRHAVRPAVAPLSAVGMRGVIHLRRRLEELAPGREAREDPAALALRHQVLTMQRVLDVQRERIEALERWRSELRGFPCKLIDARVVGSEPLPLRSRRLLWASRKDGVGPGDLVTARPLVHEAPWALPEKLAVLASSYVVGRIVDSAAFSSTLQLVSDPHFQMPAKLWRLVEPGGQRTVQVAGPSGGLVRRTFRHDGRSAGPQPVGDCIEVRAEGDGRQVLLRHVPAQHEVLPGDVLTSSDSSELLPFGLTIGRVVRTEPEKRSPHFVTVVVEPLADLHTLGEVYIVVPLARGEG